jgi:hypothetical protein
VDNSQISAQTLDMIKKATATAGVNSASGLTGIDLAGLISLIPVVTPFYDSLARSTPTMGGKFAEWKALLNVNNTQPDPSTAFDQAAAIVNLQEQDVAAYYGKVGAGYTVTMDSIDFGKGYADAKSVAIFNALNQYKIGMDKKALGGQNFALPTPGTPAVTPSATGGTIAGGTAVPVKVAARTGSNYNYGGSTVASAQGSATTSTTGATNSAVATVAFVPGAVAYDWYVNGFYYTTTTVNKVTITAIPTANQAVPSNLPGLYSVAPTSVPAVDSSAKPNDFNGLLATLAGDYATGGALGLVQRGSGLNSGASFTSLDGNPFTVSGQSVKELDALNLNIWNAVNLSPTAYMVSAQEASSISSAILNSAGGGTTFYAPNNPAEREGAIAGGFIGWYVNKAAGGVPVKIEVQPNLTPGTVIARTDRVPFPNSNITNTLELRNLHDVQDHEYPAARVAGAGGGPRFDGETYSLSTLANRAPVTMGVIQNIAAS